MTLSPPPPPQGLRPTLERGFAPIPRAPGGSSAAGGRGLSLVLGVFQEAAYDEPDLLAVVARIERSLARNL
ncbi:hypothetical protein ABZ504_38095, partial [Streptomyces mirabilis]